MSHLSDETLNEYLDGRLGVAERHRVESHLMDCADCAAQLAGLQTLFAELESLPDLPLTHDLTPGVLRRLPAPATLPRRMRLALLIQALLAIGLAALAFPFVSEMIQSVLTEPVRLPALTELWPALESSWAAWLQGVALFIPLEFAFDFSFGLDVSGLWLALTAIGALLLVIVGNHALLKPRKLTSPLNGGPIKN